MHVNEKTLILYYDMYVIMFVVPLSSFLSNTSTAIIVNSDIEQENSNETCYQPFSVDLRVLSV